MKRNPITKYNICANQLGGCETCDKIMSYDPQFLRNNKRATSSLNSISLVTVCICRSV